MAGSVAAVAGTAAWAADSKDGMPMRALGRTGEKVSAIGLGGYHIGIQGDEAESISLVRSGIDGGITFMDNCWDYNGGESEVRMGKALRDGYRARVFLMTKIDSRSRQGAMRQIDESLKRLQTDHVDLLQFHEIIRMGDPERVFAPGGALEGALEAKAAGKVRFIGFTGHKDPKIHLHMLEYAAGQKFRFDAVQMPLNVMDAHYNSFAQNVVPVLVKDEIGVLGMKPMGSGSILRSGTATAVECLRYALNLPTSVVITGMDSQRILNQALETARAFKPMSQDELSALLARTADAAATGDFEGFKTSSRFDGTAHNPDWMS
jgi:predicted aldo/keto reductase-like oxidoreductase